MNINRSLLAVASIALLAGCSGTTYGTGTSQEQQLVSDVSSLLTLNRTEAKKINYSARSGLVKPKDTSTLPPPAETVKSENTYFPQNPEELEARIRDEADREDEIKRNGGTLSPQLQALRDESRARNRRASFRKSLGDGDIPETYQEILDRQKEFRRRKALREGPSDPKARKYLTQPPVEYRTPAPTAAVGEVGEVEKDPNLRKKKKGFLKNILGS